VLSLQRAGCIISDGNLLTLHKTCSTNWNLIFKS